MTFRFLVSFAFHRQTDLAEIVRSADGTCEVFADSGAFSAATTGITVNLADYAAWLRQWNGLITTASTLDVIGDHEATRRNTRALEQHGLRVLPVFHTGTPWGRLEDLCRNYRYVALGGMVPYASRQPEVMRWLIRCFQIARDHGTVFHGFGQTSFRTLAALPFYSIDSSTWAGSARYGAMVLWDHRRTQLRQIQTGNPAVVRACADLLRSHGADPALVARPGFGLKSRRTLDQYRIEDQMNRSAPAVAYHRFGQWLTSRHQVQPPPGWATTGTALYLADTALRNLRVAGAAIAADSTRNQQTQ